VLYAAGAVSSFTILETVLSRGFTRSMAQHHTGAVALGTALNVVSVAGDGDGGAAGRFDLSGGLGGGGFVAIDRRDVCTLLGEREGGRSSDAGAGAGDEGDLVGESCGVHG
jgi:hypothetical protein